MLELLQVKGLGPKKIATIWKEMGIESIGELLYACQENRLLIEQQRLTAPSFLNRLHYRNGYEQPFWAAKIWAAIVDLVIVALLFWVASGLWLWWELKPTRRWGAVFGLLGCGVFGVLLASI